MSENTPFFPICELNTTILNVVNRFWMDRGTNMYLPTEECVRYVTHELLPLSKIQFVERMPQFEAPGS